MPSGSVLHSKSWQSPSQVAACDDDHDADDADDHGGDDGGGGDDDGGAYGDVHDEDDKAPLY